MAVAADVVAIVAVFGAGGGFGFCQGHIVTDGKERHRLYCGLFPAQFVRIYPAAGIAEIVGGIAVFGAGRSGGRDEVEGADVGQAVVDVGGGEGFVAVTNRYLFPCDFIAAVVDIF